jgi:spiro-SPASM protein
LKNFVCGAAGEKIPEAKDIEKIILEKPEILRTLPAYYPIQVFGGCPQSCSICPYPTVANVKERKDFMDADSFEVLLDKIAAFSKTAVIGLSLWGELSLHPQKLVLIEKVLSKKGLSLVIETSGIGWKNEELEKCAELAKNTSLSWIVSLDTIDPKRYAQIRGQGFAEAQSCVQKLFQLFPKDCYVQALRIKGEEDDAEKFYRHWKEQAPLGDANIIIQKYNDFCGKLEKKQASDISPVIRKPCWHIMRDMPVLLDGNVPLCRDDFSASVLGNVFTDSLESIWQKGDKHYREQCENKYTGLCKNCDEYYTYNF